MVRQLPVPVRRVGFVSTRIDGTDGVSLETRKWAEIIERMGIECYYIAGETDRSAERSAIIEEARFSHPVIQEIDRRAFGTEKRDRQLTRDIFNTARRIAARLDDAIKQFELDALIAENSLTIPMNIPLGIAIVQTIQDLGLPCVAHHHDFIWERDRFLVNAVDDFLVAAFPPPLRQIQHVVINSQAEGEFTRRMGISCRVIPNVMDFASPPDPPDNYALGFRRSIGLSEDDLLVLQPTRVVPRKGIEHSITLLRELGDPRAKLVVSHAAGDEGYEYLDWIRRYAKMLDVDVIFAARWISDTRGSDSDGRKLFSIWDVFPQADLVTYPSTYEGFGNAFLEAIYFKQPIFCNRYSIYRTDIEPVGFGTVAMDGFLTDDAVSEARRVLSDDVYRREMVEKNFALARRFFSFDAAERQLRALFCPVA